MKLIVGLGNPGKEYEKTRHNAGYRFIDQYAKSKDLEINKEKFGGFYVTFNQSNEKIILLKPAKFMNLSGEVIKDFIKYFKINIEDILIIADDLDTEIGKIKLKYKGSSGGHNGLKNIEENLGTNEYKRLKIGISNNKDKNKKEYVLEKINDEELEKINEVNKVSKDLIDDFINKDFDKVMSKYNKRG